MARYYADHIDALRWAFDTYSAMASDQGKPDNRFTVNLAEFCQLLVDTGLLRADITNTHSAGQNNDSELSLTVRSQACPWQPTGGAAHSHAWVAFLLLCRPPARYSPASSGTRRARLSRPAWRTRCRNWCSASSSKPSPGAKHGSLSLEWRGRVAAPSGGVAECLTTTLRCAAQVWVRQV